MIISSFRFSFFLNSRQLWCNDLFLCFQIDDFETQERLGRGPDEIDLLERQLKSDEPAMASYSLDWDTKDLEAYLEASPPISPPEKRRALEQAIHRRSVSPVRSMSPVRSSSPARSLSPRRSVSPRRTRSRSPTRTRSPARLASRSPLRSVRLSHSPARSIDSLGKLCFDWLNELWRF